MSKFPVCAAFVVATVALGAFGCADDVTAPDAGDAGVQGETGGDATEPEDAGDTASPEDGGDDAPSSDTNDSHTTDTTDGGDTGAGDTSDEDTGDGSDLCEPDKSDETLCSERELECGTKIVDSSCGRSEVACGECTEFENSTCENNTCTCETTSCNQLNERCGVFSDGCGGTITCTSDCSDALATGGYHTCFLDRSAGEVACWGWNKYGQLGTGSDNTENYNTPQVVSASFTSPTSLTAGEDMTCLVDDGEAKCWGANYHGQALGYQQNMSGNTIKKVLNPTSPKVPGVGIRQIEAQVQHTCAITSSQEVYCWGHNWPAADGILVNSTQKTAVKPTQYTFGSTQTARLVDAGALHTCAEATNGELWCWGTDGFGAIGDGKPVSWGYHSPQKVSGFAQGFLQVESGGMDTNKGGDSASFFHDFSCAIDVAGAAKCWGSDADGELGNDNNKQTQSGNAAEPAPVQVKGLVTDVHDLALGGSHACAIQSGDVYCWGGNEHGQLGDGTTTERPTPTKISMPNNAYAEDVEAGYFHTCARLRNDSLACWGRNDDGQLGDGTYTERKTPVIVTP